MTKYRVNAPGSTLNVRHAGQRIGSLANGTIVDGTLIADKVHIDCTLASSFLLPVDVIPPTPTPGPSTGNLKLGLNCLGNGQAARDAAKLGCHAFLLMGPKDVAVELAQNPANVVLYREYVASWRISGVQLAQRIGGGPNGVIYMLFNEADSYSYGTVDELNTRITAELDATAILLKRGCKVALGTYSVGTPDFTNPQICDVLKSRIAPIYNNNPNVYLDMHLYSPSVNHAMDEWFEYRYLWLWRSCGFDPTLHKIVSSECGIDVGSVGGFPAAKVDAAGFAKWCNDFTVVSTPQLIAACLFQHGDAKWAGYEVGGYMGELEKLWKV